jgi:hypothetical protein
MDAYAHKIVQCVLLLEVRKVPKVCITSLPITAYAASINPRYSTSISIFRYYEFFSELAERFPATHLVNISKIENSNGHESSELCVIKNR